MAKKTSTRRRDDDVWGSGSEPDTTDDGKDVDLTSKLLGQVEMLVGQVARQQDQITTLLSTPPQVVYPAHEPELGNNYGGGNGPAFIDPLEDPDGFAQSLEARIEQRIQAGIDAYAQAQAASQNAAASYDDLWNGFADKYEHWADFPDEIQFATQKVMKRVLTDNPGIDAQAYMFRNRAKFYEEVNNAAIELFGEPEPVEETQQGAGGLYPHGAPMFSEPDRTAGISGGEGGVAPPRGRKGPDQSDMVTEIINTQKESGFY